MAPCSKLVFIVDTVFLLMLLAVEVTHGNPFRNQRLGAGSFNRRQESRWRSRSLRSRASMRSQPHFQQRLIHPGTGNSNFGPHMRNPPVNPAPSFQRLRSPPQSPAAANHNRTIKIIERTIFVSQNQNVVPSGARTGQGPAAHTPLHPQGMFGRNRAGSQRGLLGQGKGRTRLTARRRAFVGGNGGSRSLNGQTGSRSHTGSGAQSGSGGRTGSGNAGSSQTIVVAGKNGRPPIVVRTQGHVAVSNFRNPDGSSSLVIAPQRSMLKTTVAPMPVEPGEDPEVPPTPQPKQRRWQGNSHWSQRRMVSTAAPNFDF